MPTYAYACTTCDHRFEAVQSFSDDALTVCPECGGRLRKVFGSVGVVFKGSGFYRTDSRSSAKGGGSAGKEAAKGDGATPSKESTPAKESASTSSSSSSSSAGSSGSAASPAA